MIRKIWIPCVLVMVFSGCNTLDIERQTMNSQITRSIASHDLNEVEFFRDIKELEERAKLGKVSAIYLLAEVYRKNHDDDSYKEMASWYEQATKENNVKAQFQLAKAYKYGKGVSVDDRRAFKWFEAAGKRNHWQSQFELGEMYAQGRGVSMNVKKAKDWYGRSVKNRKKWEKALEKKTASETEAMALKKLREIKVKVKKHLLPGGIDFREELTSREDSISREDLVSRANQKAFYWYEKAAELGHALSQYQLAEMYRLGLGTERDLKKAFKWYESSASDRQHPRATFRLAEAYFFGYGVTRDLENGIIYYKELTESKNRTHSLEIEEKKMEAQYRLGHIYYNDDKKEALKWYSGIAKKGHLKAMEMILNLYVEGDVNKKTLSSINRLYDKNRLSGPSVAELNLFRDYGSDGLSRKEINLAHSAEFLSKYESIAEKGDKMVKNSLAQMLEKGTNVFGDTYVDVNLKQALVWYKRAAKAGHKPAFHKVASIYLDGAKNVDMNIPEAIRWYKLAVNHLDFRATEKLGDIYSESPFLEKNMVRANKWYAVYSAYVSE